MPPKKFARFVSSTSVSRPERRPRVRETPEQFKKAAEAVYQQLDQFIPLPQAPAVPPPEWPDIVGNNDPDPGEGGRAHHVVHPPRHHQRRFRSYFDKREDYHKQWGQIKNQVSSTYLYCQHVTKNWTSQHTYLGTRPPGCNCTLEGQQNLRSVDLIDTLGFHSSMPVSFCSCQPDVIQLLHQGYMASSPSKPCTAFLIQLLQLYHTLWQTVGVSKSGFIEGLLRSISSRTRDKLLSQGIKENSRTLRVPFSNTIDVYTRVQLVQSSLYSEGMLHTKEDTWASKCPRCFGPAENEDRNEQEFFAIFCMDGNFQQRHNAQASKDTPTDDQYPSIFVKPSEVSKDEATVQTTENMPIDGGQNPCSDSHKAANDLRNTSTWSQCDDTGLFAALCRHDVPLQVVNVYKSGEKLYYPISLIKSIIKDFPGKRFGILYDIGCHLERHLQCQNLLPEDRARLQFGTSVFHAYVHEWKCQLKYNPRYNDQWGLSDGEGLERLWSFLSILVGVLRTSTRLHRLISIFERIMHFIEVILQNSGKWLSVRMKQAVSTLKKSQTLLTNIYALPNPYKPGHKYTEQYLLEQWNAERSTLLDPKSQQEKQKLELGKLLCLEDELDQAWKATIESAEQALAQARVVGDLQKRIEAQKKKIGINQLTNNLQAKHTTLFLKVWYAKTTVRSLYLAIKEEKRPLEVVQQVGMATKLGYRGQEKVLAAIKARAAKLRPALDMYNRHLAAFKAAFPERVAPSPMDFKQLMVSRPDDQFWNDGLFTYENQPWAIDPPTQVGMRALARMCRCNEEKRRLQWETRRLMQWTSQQFRQLQDLLLRLGSHPEAGRDATTKARLKAFMDNPGFSSLAPAEQTVAIKVLVHKNFDRICRLYESWNTPVLEVFRSTSQRGDEQLACVWHYQMAQVTYLQTNKYLSMVPGDCEGTIQGLMVFYHITLGIVPDLAVGGVLNNPNVNDDLDADGEWEDDIEDIFERDLNLDEIDMVLERNDQGEHDD